LKVDEEPFGFFLTWSGQYDSAVPKLVKEVPLIEPSDGLNHKPWVSACPVSKLLPGHRAWLRGVEED